jgi:heterogeneous nuclear ribonucleoprotein A1/A3
MSRKLFVGGLSWSTDNDSLRGAFERYGQIEDAKVIFDRDSGRSKGFGFVTYAFDEDADTAITALNDTELQGRKIRVSDAISKPRDSHQQPRSYDRNSYDRGSYDRGSYDKGGFDRRRG